LAHFAFQMHIISDSNSQCLPRPFTDRSSRSDHTAANQTLLFSTIKISLFEQIFTNMVFHGSKHSNVHHIH